MLFEVTENETVLGKTANVVANAAVVAGVIYGAVKLVEHFGLLEDAVNTVGDAADDAAKDVLDIFLK